MDSISLRLVLRVFLPLIFLTIQLPVCRAAVSPGVYYLDRSDFLTVLFDESLGSEEDLAKLQNEAWVDDARETRIQYELFRNGTCRAEGRAQGNDFKFEGTYEEKGDRVRMSWKKSGMAETDSVVLRVEDEDTLSSFGPARMRFVKDRYWNEGKLEVLLSALTGDREDLAKVLAAQSDYEEEPLFRLLAHGAVALRRDDLWGLIMESAYPIDYRTEASGVMPFMLAAKSGYDEFSELVLEDSRYLLRETDAEGRNIFYHASLDGELDLSEFESEEILSLLGASTRTETASLDPSAFLEAVQNQDAIQIQDALINGYDLSGHDALGFEAVCLALEMGDLAILELLARSGAPLEKGEDSTLGRALELGRSDLAQCLLDSGAAWNEVDWESSPLVAFAAEKGDAEYLRILTAHGLEPFAEDRAGFTPVYRFLKLDRSDLLGALIEDGFVRGQEEAVSLMAVDLLASQCIELLEASGHLAKGIVKGGGNLVNHVGFSHSSDEAESCASTLQELAEAGLSVNEKSGSGGETPLHLAARWGSLVGVQTLLALGANVDLRDDHGRSALHVASEEDQLETIAALVDGGAELEGTDEQGFTPLMSAVPSGSVEDLEGEEAYLDTLRLLKGRGANIMAADSKGRTALHLAVYNGVAPAVLLLTEMGCDPVGTDLQGRTPLHYVWMPRTYFRGAREDQVAGLHLNVLDSILAAGGMNQLRDRDGKRALDYARAERFGPIGPWGEGRRRLESWNGLGRFAPKQTMSQPRTGMIVAVDLSGKKSVLPQAEPVEPTLVSEEGAEPRVVSGLPGGFQTFLHEGGTLFFSQGHFYKQVRVGFEEIPVPYGATLIGRPEGASPSSAGTDEWEAHGIRFRQKREYGREVYEIIR
ncbi:ankyrin repeat domain-containing protein [Pelagicoccus albus]|uniref:Ankyrin repeat n=1 Tax=Pelagicoccus albus TaxID=415222 RepID=A0A7X1B7Y4_9BACT|nr:ankyrin repeat domain-containing protein [Pelagicoccus albus]MBC2606073.1 hypothetical protein [Pelagicoccus albus]